MTEILQENSNNQSEEEIGGTLGCIAGCTTVCVLTEMVGGAVGVALYTF